MKRQAKLDLVTSLLADGGGKFTHVALLAAADSPVGESVQVTPKTQARIARSAVFLSRQMGLKLEAFRDGGRKVISYVQLDWVKPEVVATVETPAEDVVDVKDEDGDKDEEEVDTDPRHIHPSEIQPVAPVPQVDGAGGWKSREEYSGAK